MLVIISMMLVITMKQYHQVIKVIVISVDVNCAHHKCDHQHDVDGDHQHDVDGDHQHDVEDDHQHDVGDDHQHDVEDDHQHDVGDDHQHDVDGDHQHDVGDHYEAISWQGGLVKVDWPVEAVMPFSLTSGRHRHHD